MWEHGIPLNFLYNTLGSFIYVMSSCQMLEGKAPERVECWSPLQSLWSAGHCSPKDRAVQGGFQETGSGPGSWSSTADTDQWHNFQLCPCSSWVTFFHVLLFHVLLCFTQNNTDPRVALDKGWLVIFPDWRVECPAWFRHVTSAIECKQC